MHNRRYRYCKSKNLFNIIRWLCFQTVNWPLITYTHTEKHPIEPIIFKAKYLLTLCEAIDLWVLHTQVEHISGTNVNII